MLICYVDNLQVIALHHEVEGLPMTGFSLLVDCPVMHCNVSDMMGKISMYIAE